MKAFNRFVLAACVALGASYIGSVSASAQTVTISGEVASTSAVTPSNANTNLPMGGVGTDLGAQIVKAADLALISNNSGGVALTMTSGDLGNGTDTVAFQVVSVADTATPVAGDFTTATGGTHTDNVTAFTAGAAERDMFVLYDPPALLDPGTYSAIITVGVTDL